MAVEHTSPIPDPVLRIVENLTPFSHFACCKMGPRRRFFDTLVVKAAFDLSPGTLSGSGPAPICMADEYWDPSDAKGSSLRRAGDAVLVKPGTDVIVTGHAKSPAGRPARGWDVGVVVRDGSVNILRHTLRVTAPRRWEYRAVRGWTISEPDVATEVPIRYEIAYGGSYDKQLGEGRTEWVAYEPNPCGTGFVDAARLDKHRAHAAPQWHLPESPVTGLNEHVPLAGLGPVARPWRSRARFAGTYDDAWLRQFREAVDSGLPPDYPPDFDLGFFHCAHPALIATHRLRGDEHIGLAGLLGDPAPFVTRLPGLRVEASLYSESAGWRDAVLPLDTVHIDLDARKAYLSWRLSLDQRDGTVAVVLESIPGGRDG